MSKNELLSTKKSTKKGPKTKRSRKVIFCEDFYSSYIMDLFYKSTNLNLTQN